MESVRVVSDQRGPAIRALAGSGRQRYHWQGRHPDFPDVVYLFETVIDGGEHWTIRHLELHSGGERLTEAEFAAAWTHGTAPRIGS
jgi:hypothetical protein